MVQGIVFHAKRVRELLQQSIRVIASADLLPGECQQMYHLCGIGRSTP